MHSSVLKEGFPVGKGSGDGGWTTREDISKTVPPTRNLSRFDDQRDRNKWEHSPKKQSSPELVRGSPGSQFSACYLWAAK